jgi:hypothetical protein
LGRHLNGHAERLVELLFIPMADREADMTRILGHRVRRFCLERIGHTGRVCFLDGTPTMIRFDLGRDEPALLRWLGLACLCDGERQWFDLAARPIEPVTEVSPSAPTASQAEPFSDPL